MKLGRRALLVLVIIVLRDTALLLNAIIGSGLLFITNTEAM
jgi:hypothetical protein